MIVSLWTNWLDSGQFLCPLHELRITAHIRGTHETRSTLYGSLKTADTLDTGQKPEGTRGNPGTPGTRGNQRQARRTPQKTNPHQTNTLLTYSACVPAVLCHVDSRLNEQTFKLIPGPLQGVFDGVWEIFKSTYRNLLLYE